MELGVLLAMLELLVDAVVCCWSAGRDWSVVDRDWSVFVVLESVLEALIPTPLWEREVSVAP